jgi:hypothetical protein
LLRSRSLTHARLLIVRSGAEGAIAETLARSRRRGSATFTAAERESFAPDAELPRRMGGSRIEGSEEVTGDGDRRSAER